MDPFELLQSMVVRDVGRGSEKLAALCRDDMRHAARRLSDLPVGAQVIIVTGFFIADASPPAAETDGPLGAVTLAETFGAMGFDSTVVTDSYCLSVVSAAAAAAGTDVKVAGLDDAQQLQQATGYAPNDLAAIVFVERPGRAKDGRSYSMRSVDLSPWTAPLGDLLTLCPTALSVAIADGGNEIGIGKLDPSQVEEAATLDLAAISVEATDHLVIAAVSNWGAWALAAAIGRLRGDLRNEVSAALDQVAIKTQLDAMVRSGAVDGVSGTSSLSIDGFDWPIHASVLNAIGAVLEMGKLPDDADHDNNLEG